ncbi:hypothetical protein [Limnoglobus roseus]|uniref:Uncharacterized protein n=1 Tax=Limnoglobus roseus TaxID=2598579 RepID=A0A5C1A9Y8_9BACT|nr:hypothetical protein [Limnoglobus roseus]QEL14846.1 hypothetical protein PX52LOC_01744 [Limnoglobus roseus]
MAFTDILPFALLALSSIAVPLMLFVAFRALKRRDESREPTAAPRHSPRKQAKRPAGRSPRFPGR